jgi:hypothetical protein
VLRSVEVIVMTRLAKILATALAISLIAASAAFAKAPQHAGQSVKDQNDGAAIAVVAGIGLFVAGSALVPLGRRRRVTVRNEASRRPSPASA